MRIWATTIARQAVSSKTHVTYVHCSNSVRSCHWMYAYRNHAIVPVCNRGHRRSSAQRNLRDEFVRWTRVSTHSSVASRDHAINATRLIRTALLRNLDAGKQQAMLDLMSSRGVIRFAMRLCAISTPRLTKHVDVSYNIHKTFTRVVRHQIGPCPHHSSMPQPVRNSHACSVAVVRLVLFWFRMCMA